MAYSDSGGRSMPNFDPSLTYKHRGLPPPGGVAQYLPPPPPSSYHPSHPSSSGSSGHSSNQAAAPATPTSNLIDPATGQPYDAALIRAVQSHLPRGQAITPTDIRLYKDEVDVQSLRPSGLQGLSGFQFPKDMSENGMIQMLDFADQFANAAGWGFFPTGAQLLQAYNSGSTSYADIAAMWAHGTMSAAQQAAKPWVANGMTSVEWKQKKDALSQTLQGWTGTSNLNFDGPIKDALNTAIAQGWDSNHWQQFISQNETLNKQYGWVKHGLSYNQMQQSLLDNKIPLQQRYGLGGDTSGNLVKNLDDPLLRFAASATPTQYAAQSASSTWQKASPLEEFNQSKVR